MDITLDEQGIRILLSNDEGLVLFELLARLSDEKNESLYEDHSELRVIWDLECCLETVLSEPFHKNYSTLLSEARQRVRNE